MFMFLFFTILSVFDCYFTNGSWSWCWKL